MILVPYTSDADEIAALYLASRRRHVAFAAIPQTDVEVRQWVRQLLLGEGRFCVIKESDRIVALMGYSEAQDATWIDQLYVHPEMTSRGFGSELITGAKRNLRPPIQLFTFQENLGSRRFFERHGFVATRFSDGRHNQEQCPDVLYRWGD